MLQFATFLSPVLYDTYAAITRYVGEQLGVPTSLRVGQSLDEFVRGKADVGFLCGLLYTNMPQLRSIELLAAPIVQGDRYRNEPIYYSDVIVRRKSAYSTFADLQGCCWAFNEEASHSGYNVVSYSLLKHDKTFDYFGSLHKTGSHLASLQAVLTGRADATAIDSHVLDVTFKQQPELRQQLRVIDMMGPSTIPPIVASTHLSANVRRDIQEILQRMHSDKRAVKGLHAGLIEQLVPISDSRYDDVRCMRSKTREMSMIKVYQS